MKSDRDQPQGGQKSPITRARVVGIPDVVDARASAIEAARRDQSELGLEADRANALLRGFERIRSRAAVCADWLRVTVSYPFEYLFTLRSAFAEAREMQSQERRLGDLLKALPAILVVVLCGVAGGAGIVQRWQLVERYGKAAVDAESRNDDRAVRVLAGRAYDLTGAPQSLYLVATASDRLGKNAEAERVMRQLAEEPNFGPAHLWLANRALASGSLRPDPKRLRDAIEQLRLAEAEGTSTTAISLSLGRALAASGDLKAAIPYLEVASRDDVLQRLELAGAYARLGRDADSRRAVESAEVDLRRRVAENPEDRPARARWVASLLNLGRRDAALEALEAAGRDALRADAALGGLYVLACLAEEEQLKTRGAAASERYEWVRRALDAQPASVDGLLRLIAITDEGLPDAQRGEAKDLLEAALKRGAPSASILVALGGQAWKAGDLETARSYLEQAYAFEPSNVVAANNLAWLLARDGDVEQCTRALGIVDELVKRHPDMHQFRDTRGQILAKLGRWKEALVDLERAIAGMQGSVETRRTLAEAYRQAGRSNLAELQDKEADRLEAKAPSVPARPSPN